MFTGGDELVTRETRGLAEYFLPGDGRLGICPVPMTDMECGMLELAEAGSETPFWWCGEGTSVTGIGGK